MVDLVHELRDPAIGDDRLRAHRDEKENGGRDGGLEQMLEQLQRDVVGQMQVLQDDDEQSLAAELGEQRGEASTGARPAWWMLVHADVVALR